VLSHALPKHAYLSVLVLLRPAAITRSADDAQLGEGQLVLCVGVPVGTDTVKGAVMSVATGWRDWRQRSAEEQQMADIAQLLVGSAGCAAGNPTNIFS